MMYIYVQQHDLLRICMICRALCLLNCYLIQEISCYSAREMCLGQFKETIVKFLRAFSKDAYAKAYVQYLQVN